MALPFRVEYPGAAYHVMNRGDRRELIFLDDVDRRHKLSGHLVSGQGDYLRTVCESTGRPGKEGTDID